MSRRAQTIQGSAAPRTEPWMDLPAEVRLSALDLVDRFREVEGRRPDCEAFHVITITSDESRDYERVARNLVHKLGKGLSLEKLLALRKIGLTPFGVQNRINLWVYDKIDAM